MPNTTTLLVRDITTQRHLWLPCFGLSSYRGSFADAGAGEGE
ncbi:MAG TPA: hypothetical protein VJA28_03050 [Patescibacteria group bacterium]|nr:hypothetical protein [Patescibacteria group bacterium]